MTMMKCYSLAIGACVVLSACGEPQDSFKSETGPLTPSFVETINLEDEARGKTLIVQATFPEEAGNYPLIVFSQGTPVLASTEIRRRSIVFM